MPTSTRSSERQAFYDSILENFWVGLAECGLGEVVKHEKSDRMLYANIDFYAYEYLDVHWYDDFEDNCARCGVKVKPSNYNMGDFYDESRSLTCASGMAHVSKDKIYRVTAETVSKGYNKVLKQTDDNRLVGTAMLDGLKEAYRDCDPGNLDVLDAMALVEIGVYGEVVYG